MPGLRRLLCTLFLPPAFLLAAPLSFRDGGPSGRKNHLLFTAGIADESHGLFGFIRPADAEDEHDDTE